MEADLEIRARGTWSQHYHKFSLCSCDRGFEWRNFSWRLALICLKPITQSLGMYSWERRRFITGRLFYHSLSIAFLQVHWAFVSEHIWAQKDGAYNWRYIFHSAQDLIYLLAIFQKCKCFWDTNMHDFLLSQSMICILKGHTPTHFSEVQVQK